MAIEPGSTSDSAQKRVRDNRLQYPTARGDHSAAQPEERKLLTSGSSLFSASASSWTGRTLSILRVVVGFLFVAHGTMKLFGYPPMPPGAPPIELVSQAGLAGILETFGGVAIMLGVLTRPVAFILSGEMAVAYFQVHFPQGFLPAVNGGELAVLYCFIFLYFVFAGAGPWSVDAMIQRRRT
jgi:putative oxidoreductase